MNFKQSFRFLGTALLAPAVAFLLIVAPAQAQNFNVEVSPAKVNLQVEAGDIREEIFRVANYSGSDQTFFIYVRDFSVSDESGSPTFTEGAREVNERFSLKEWVTLPFSQIKVLDGQVREVVVAIDVPTDAEPGGHYAAVFFQTEDPARSSTTGVGAVGRIASLMLVNVPGDVEEKIILNQFQTERSVYYDPNMQINVTTLLENKGSVHGYPTGAIFLTGGIGMKPRNIIYNQSQAAVLPGSPPRRITESFVLEKNGLFPPMGKFTLELVGRYGSKNYPIEGIAEFWVIPWKFLTIVVVVIVLLGFMVWRVVLSFKK